MPGSASSELAATCHISLRNLSARPMLVWLLVVGSLLSVRCAEDDDGGRPVDGGADAEPVDGGAHMDEAQVPEPDATTDLDPPRDGGVPAFEDHTFLRFASLADLEEHLVGAPGRRQCKFLITRFGDAEEQLLFLDGQFYSLHDEWYWFRLLNGQPVVGDETEPVTGHSFASVAEIVDWARQQAVLPLDLKFVEGGRLYSPRFYRLGLDLQPRVFGLGGLLHVAAVEGIRPELWLFELEYGDDPTHAELTRFFEQLDATLPPALAGRVRWVVRSPVQEALAHQMEEQQLRYWDRITRYQELAIPGETEVYSPGITAGRLKLFQADEPGLESTRPTDVLLLEAVPDFLPQAAALITGVPQTPLAHINILAKNRGIPNAYRGGITDDPTLDQLARGYAPILVQAVEPATLRLQQISEAEYRNYLQLIQPPPLVVPPIDLTGVPVAMPLAGLPLSQMAELRPILGGKCAGMIALTASQPDERAGVTPPPHPTCLTIKPFVEFMTPLQPVISAMLEAPEFTGSALVRLLILEGPVGFDARNPDPASRRFREEFAATHPDGPLGTILAAGGLRSLITARPIPANLLAELRAILEEQFADHSPQQALRFRSSSNVEDIEGFNGAGLYESFTGFLFPEQQASRSDRAKTLDIAIRKTWASYWAVEAFEERRLAQVDHRSGSMGVLVHARFDDERELANGVLTFTLLPRRVSPEIRAVLDLNMQLGSLSVTNPPVGSGALPEVTRLEQGTPEQELRITRIRESTEVPPGQPLLHDQELAALFRQVRLLAEAWLEQNNGGLTPARRSQVVVLDLEVKQVDAGWPQLVAGPAFASRLILKQVRSLDPGLSRIPTAAQDKPFPRDLLSRARRVERRVCATAAYTLITYEAYTDPGRPPDMGHAATPFNALLALSFRQPLPALGILAGHQAALDHTAFAAVAHPETSAGRWDLELSLTEAAAANARFDRLRITAEGEWTLFQGAETASGRGVQCSVELLYASPADYLLGLLRP